MKKILLLIFIIFCVNQVCAQNNFSNMQTILNPDQFFPVSDSVLLVMELGNKDRELCLINIYTDEYVQCTRKGKGPGEFSGAVTRMSIDYESEEIIVWDAGNQRLTTFSFELDLIDESSAVGNLSGVLMAFPLKEKKRFLLRFKPGFFAEIVDTQSDSVIITVDDEDELLAPLKDNFLLRQGIFALERGKESIVFATKYSSTLLKVSPSNGLNFITLGSPNIPFPDPEPEDGYSIPSLHKYTTSSLDVSIDNGKIYVLHSGKRTSYREGFWYLVRGRIEELGENLEKGKELLVYNLYDGSFVQSFELPFEAKKAKVFNDNIYALQDTKGEIALSVLSLTDL